MNGNVAVAQATSQEVVLPERVREALGQLVGAAKEGLPALRTYAGRAAVSLAVCAFLKAIRPLASWRSARWFSSFFDQRMRMPRLRFSQEWLASTTQRRARQPGVRIFSAISSPRARMCAVNSYPATRSRTSLLSYARSRQMPCGAPGVGFGRSTGIESIVSFRSL